MQQTICAQQRQLVARFGTAAKDNEKESEGEEAEDLLPGGGPALRRNRAGERQQGDAVKSLA